MVYRGKPSTGCKRCRQRKIKCDERPGGCLKCESKSFTCPGYDPTSTDLFRDESTSVQIKADKAKAKALLDREKRESLRSKQHSSSPLESHHHDTDSELVIINPTKESHPYFTHKRPFIPLVDQAITYFMNTYAQGLETPPVQPKNYNQHLSTYGFHPVVATCMTALGIAGVANLCLDANLKRESTKWYISALRMVNVAIQDPKQVKSDNTLLAIMLLGTFETTTNDKSLIGWANHIAGSASLLKMRGKEQFQTPVGRRLWLQLVTMLSIHCMGREEGLPKFVHELNKEVENWGNMKDPGMQFYYLHIAAVELRADIMQKRITDLRVVVERAVELDTAAVAMMRDLHSQNKWLYKIVHCAEGTPGVFGSSYHIYPHLAASQTWNWIRYTRIYLNDFIRNSLLAGFAATPPVFRGTQAIGLLESATETLYQMQADILASMPQYLHDTPRSFDVLQLSRSHSHTPSTSESTTESTSTTSSAQTHHSPSNSPSTSPRFDTTVQQSPFPKHFTSNFNPKPSLVFTNISSTHAPACPQDTLPVLGVSNGQSSLWALYIAGTTPIASSETQEYVAKTLLRTAEEYGINQAKILAGALKLKMKLDRCGGGVGDFGEGAVMDRIVPMYLPSIGPHVA